MPTATGAATYSLPGPRVEPAVRVHDQQQAADPSRRALSGTTPAGPAARNH
ncbi:hypothetical protein AB0D65_09065 [Streptomyces griseoloalbus]|uniref:Uncharacterized protein n=1 Tax=Streptomyces griseoloalbus TaxID=67303 RepID=A0ABV3E1Z9_9ACTN